MAPLFTNNLVRRYTVQFLEEETVKNKLWGRLVSYRNSSDGLRLHSLLTGRLQPQTKWFLPWRRNPDSKHGDIEMRSGDTGAIY